ncbi:AAA-like domain protein [Roseimaritima ulvae]|uniref:AAA-like domain protein n=2 Tax=Roseimaritima ulvae TaxID=980254 RepID=A0A5B9QMX1_9BACT|nr:AAA-like domain protein [Roseimaritima ulvae]
MSATGWLAVRTSPHSFSRTMIPSVDEFEKLGAFYLGRKYDLRAGKLLDELEMYDSKDLCTHAMCVGMTGSGKTGLCLSLLEEAAIDGIPAICLDPKGDLANLLLAFPDLDPGDFKPWLESGEAMRKGVTLDQLAGQTAKTWKQGLASWGQTPDRIRKYKQSAEFSIYTPGSNTGLQLSMLTSFDAPPAELLDDSDAMRERVTGATSGLLTLLGIDADPLRSPEHILVSSIFDHCWREGKNVSVGDLIGLIQSPPMQRVGVMDLDSFMSPSDRSKLAMQLNNLLASPAFSSWLDGEPLSIQRLLYTPEGKPRVTILSIAHLSDSERMFFVTILLNELVAWMRTQSGTSSLRALFYMDEVFGYFPPVAKPPSKPPMLTLLKQARAFGLGVMLATQNPVDLDYKGLSNIGTWFLGRLQTERDKARVLDGLEGAAIQTGQPFNKAQMEQLLAALGKRVFLMNNVHDQGPSVFQTRWAMSYLAGPLARDQINTLMADRKAAAGAHSAAEPESGVSTNNLEPSRPLVPAGIEERFIVPTLAIKQDTKLVYRPALLGLGTMHFIRVSADLDRWVDGQRLLRCGSGVPEDLWEHSETVSGDIEFEDQADEAFAFYPLPDDMCNAANYKTWTKQLKDYFYRHHAMTLYKSPLLSEYAPPGTSEGEARISLRQAAHEARDRETEKLRSRYAKKLAAVEKRIRTAEARVSREKDQFKQASVSSGISFVSTLFNAFMGNKISRRTSTTVRGATRAAQQHGDIARAEKALAELHADYADLDNELRTEIEALGEKFDVQNLELDTTVVAPRKSDLKTQTVELVWTPWQIDSHGMAERLY